MSMTFYPAVFHKADQIEKGYWVEVPDLPGCFSQGDSMEEAFKEVQEAVGACTIRLCSIRKKIQK